MMINTISTPCEPKNGVQGARAQTPETAQAENGFLSVLDQILGNPSTAAGTGQKEETSGMVGDLSLKQLQVEAEEQPSETKSDETKNIATVLPLLFAVFGQITNTKSSGAPIATNADSEKTPATPIEGSAIAAANVSVPLTETYKGVYAESLTSEFNEAIASSKAETLGNETQPDISKVTQGVAAQEISQKAALQEMVITDGNQNVPSLAEIMEGQETFDTILSRTNGMTERTAELDNGGLSKEGGLAFFSNITIDDAVKTFKMFQDGGTAQNNHAGLGKSADQTTFEVLQDASPTGDQSSPFQIEQIDSTVSGQTQEPSEKASCSGEAEKEDVVYKKEKPSDIREDTLGLITVRRGESPQTVTEATQTTNEAEAFSQVSEQVTQALSDKNSANFKMKLHPAGLGEISVTLTCQDDKVTLAIVTENPATQKLLASQADQLKAALLAKNYEVAGLHVSASSGSESNTATGNSFSFETRYSGADVNSGFTFSERSSAGSEQSGQNREDWDYSFADRVLGSEAEMGYQNRQGYYTGRLNFWA